MGDHRLERTGSEAASPAARRPPAVGPTGGEHAGLLGLQRAVGNTAVRQIVVDRQAQLGAPDAARSAAVSSDVVVVELPTRWPLRLPAGTVAEVAQAFEELDTELFIAADDVLPDRTENPYWEEWQRQRELVRWVRGSYASQVASRGSERIERQELTDLQARVRRLQWAARQGHAHHTAAVAREIDRVRKRATSAAERAQDALRAAFLARAPESDSLVRVLWDVSYKVLDVVVDLDAALTDPVPVPRAIPRAISTAVEALNVLVNWQAANPATYGTGFESMTALRNAAAIGGALLSVGGSPAKYLTTHLGPLLGGIELQLGRISASLRHDNDVMIGAGLDPLRAGVEPGGDDMRRLLEGAMLATSPADVPEPGPGAYRYLDEQRSRFDAFLGDAAAAAGEEGAEAMPTRTRWVVFTSADPARLRRWVFVNRDALWTLLYGSREKPGRRGGP